MKTFLEHYKRTCSVGAGYLLVDSNNVPVTSDLYALTEVFGPNTNDWGSNYARLNNKRFTDSGDGMFASGSRLNGGVVVFGADDAAAVFFIGPEEKFDQMSGWKQLISSGVKLTRFRGFTGKSEIGVFSIVIEMMIQYLKMHSPPQLEFAAAYKELVSVYKNASQNKSILKRFEDIGYTLTQTDKTSTDFYGPVFKLEKT